MRLVVLLLAGIAFGPAAGAQEPPPRLPYVVVDLHGSIPTFPDDARLAASRNLNPAELPGVGIGGDVGVHVYPFKWRAVTFGVGGQATFARAHRTPETSASQTTMLSPVTARFTSIAPQLSLNFGNGNGWSYLSGGVSVATWSIVHDGAESTDADRERLRTINYGGGARWFAKPHLAFSFDVRVYAISPGAADGSLPASPRTTIIIAGAGISVK